ncbi:alpha/beta fold hydrolase [Agilicoccus flavus]|uniref:alpha/beta fold hydrolase n=1 Tax=Agilicoccus flavus TaxID=2775968 RepID=UPI001CF70102|nr:alpha/beta fold hydrolase [Agilicoccus flavus]
MFERYEPFDVDVGEVRIAGRRSVGPAGLPPVLLLHGHPQTHLIWHRLADELAEHADVVAADLRGYGASGKPAGGGDHAAYAKRTMAADMVALMQTFAHDRFLVAAHDRGARVAARLALDHPDALTSALLLDVAPTSLMYAATDRAFATAYFHWFLLIRPEPLPERLLAADPRAYVEGVLGGRHAGLAPFPPEVVDAYVQALAAPGTAHGICEDYRASAGIDLEHDEADRAAGARTPVPLRVLWGAHGVVGRFEPLDAWRGWAHQVSGRALDCGHYLPEERPDDVLAEILALLVAGAPTALPQP